MGNDSGQEDGVSDASQEWGSDFLVDLLEAYDVEYLPFNPGASFRGIEESIVNWNDNEPEVITTPNESLSVSIAHGYAKATGRPGFCVLHNVVGTMNAAMAIYNAYIDRVPIVMLSGTGPMRKEHRRPWIDWIHTANVQGNIVREYVKWDDQPHHLDGLAESFVRAHEISNTRPKGPTYLTIDHALQEDPVQEPYPIPSPEDFPTPSRMAPDPDAVAQAASALVRAEFPVVLVEQLGDSREAVDALVDLADMLGSPVLDVFWRRFNFPNTHPMWMTDSDIYEEADVVLALDVWERDWVTGDWSNPLETAIEGDFTFIDVGTHELEASGLFPNTYSAHPTDIPILADTALAVPSLRDAVANRLEGDPEAQRRASNRFDGVAERHDAWRDSWQVKAAEVWDDSPISPARLVSEVFEVIDGAEWVLTNDIYPEWIRQLWDVEEYDQYIGGHDGGGGVGYGIGASIGAALAYQDSDRIPVNIQTDGGLMQYLGGLWILGHYEIPLLTVMHNNASLHNSTNHRMELAAFRGRDASHEQALIGTGFVDPIPDYAHIAEGMGVNGYGPIEDPEELRPAIEAAFEDVKSGEPALVDAICQAR